MKLIMYDDGLSYRWLETCGGVLSYRGLHETGAIQFSQMLLKHVKCTAKAIRWTQHKEESLVVLQFVDCHSANNVLKIDMFQFYMYGYIKSLY